MTKRLTRGDTLVLASHNAGKIAEFRTLLAPYGISLRSAADFALEEPDETAETFSGNALIKAEHVARATGLPALADDSGFCVNALDGRPGVYSARWGGPARDMTLAMARVQDELGDATDRGAAFFAALCLVWPDGTAHTVEGKCTGSVVWPPRGDHGHGYDPIFTPENSTLTFAEMTEAEKNAHSHRGNAVRTFVADCIANNPGA